MLKPNGRGVTRLINATRCSWQGLRHAWLNEPAFRQELTLALVLTPLGWYLADNGIERVLLLGPLFLLLAVECINSAIEAAIDRISTERHPLSGQAKDLGSTAVTFVLGLLIFSWLSVLWPF